MPALPKTSDEKVVRAARKLLEREGELSMLAVAELVGVKAPSLYKRFPDRDALLARVAADAARDLGQRIADDDQAPSARAALTKMARSYRGFAHQHPRLYGLLFSPDLTVEERTAAVQPLLKRLASLVGEDEALPAARLVTAWLHGFVSMELAGAFRLGGDVDQAFEYGLTTLLSALGSTPPRRR